jgi:hypothetical protein
VRAGETTRLDIDLRRDRLGAIRGLAAEPLPATGRVTGAFLLDQRPVWALGLCRETDLVNHRFALDTLWPGTYLLWLEDPVTGAKVAEARIEVKRGAFVEVVLARPRGTLVVPVAAVGEALQDSGETGASGGVRVAAVERWPFARYGPAREGDWEQWGGHSTTLDGTRLRVEGLPAGRVRAAISARGLVTAWSEPVDIPEGAEATAGAVVLERGRDIRVRLQPQENLPVPDHVDFVVTRAGHEESANIRCIADRLGNEPVWVLSAFAPGEYEIEVRPSGIFETARARATVAADRDVELTVALERR